MSMLKKLNTFIFLGIILGLGLGLLFAFEVIPAESLVKLLSSLAGKQIVFCQLLNHVDEHGWMPENKNEMGWRN
ncbi:hypothetical protein BVY03_05305, partial [bacterium K02(2017)]